MGVLTRLAVSTMVVLGITGSIAASTSVNATPFLQVDFTVDFAADQNAGTGFGNPFGIFDGGTDAILTGQAVFDFTGATIPSSGINDIGNFTSFAHTFSFQTGSQTWGLGDVVVDGTLGDPPFDADRVDFFGENFDGFLISLNDGVARSVLSLRNTFSINDGLGDFAFCNGCVSFTTTELDELPPVSEVPVPAALPLLLTAFAGLGLAGYRKRRSA